MKLYVGNLPFDATAAQVEALFEPHATVDAVSIIVDQATGRSRGFGFVEIAQDGKGEATIRRLNQSDFNGRTLVVREARPQPRRYDTRWQDAW